MVTAARFTNDLDAARTPLDASPIDPQLTRQAMALLQGLRPPPPAERDEDGRLRFAGSPAAVAALAHLAVKLAAYFDLEAVAGVDGGQEAAQSWTNCAERLKRHLRDDGESAGRLMSRR